MEVYHFDNPLDKHLANGLFGAGFHTISRKRGLSPRWERAREGESAHIQFASFDTRTEFIAFDLSLSLLLLCIVYLFVRFLLFCFAHIVVDCFYQHAVGSAARRQQLRADGRTDGLEAYSMDAIWTRFVCGKETNAIRVGAGWSSGNGQVKMKGVRCEF